MSIFVIFLLAIPEYALECYKETCVSLAGECVIYANVTKTETCGTNETYCMVSVSESSRKCSRKMFKITYSVRNLLVILMILKVSPINAFLYDLVTFKEHFCCGANKLVVSNKSLFLAKVP